MSGQKSFLRMKVGALLAISLLSSCAGNSTITDENAPELATSEVSAVDNIDKPGASDDNVFADLKAESKGAPAEASMSGSGLNESPTSGSVASVSDSDSPFYNSVGGESVGRVAFTLYGSKSYIKMLLKKNPEVVGVKSLSPGQKVYFDFSNANPQPKYLTKDLIDRYAAPLAERIQAKGDATGIAKTSVVVAPGETLQMVATRLYGTSRYWPEIYLLNHDKLNGYDKVKAGATLVVYQRDAVATTAAAPVRSEPVIQQPVMKPVVPSAAIVSSVAEQKAPPPATQVTTQDAPVPVVEPTPMEDPIPETPVTQAPPAVKSKPAVHEDPPGLADLGNPMTRRILYVGLLALIIGLAIVMTRQKKKKPFDMLDSTTRDTAVGRTKLMDSQNKVVG